MPSSTALARRPRAREEFAGQAQQPLYSDSFTRADNAASLGSTDGGRLPGQAWTALVGTWGVQGGQAYCPSDADASYAVIDAGLADYVVEYTRNGTWSDGTNLRKIDFVLRALDQQNLLFVDIAGGNIRCFKRDAGVQTQIGSSVAITGLVNGTTHTLKAVCQGLSIHVFVDGTLRTTFALVAATDAKFLAYPRVGLRLGKGGTPVEACRADDFRVSATSDTLVLDRFGRADSATSLGKAEIGKPWTALAVSGGSSVWGIGGGKAYLASHAGTTADYFALLDCGKGEYIISATLRFASAITNAGLLVRYTDGTNYLGFRMLPPTNQVNFIENVGGVRAAVATVSYTIALNTDYRVDVIVRDERTGQTPQVAAYINGVYVTGVAAPYLRHAGQSRVGLYSQAATPDITWDNLVVRALPRYLTQWHATDTERKLVEHGGGLVFAPHVIAAAGFNDPQVGLAKSPFRQKPGDACEWAITFSSFGSVGNGCTFGLDSTMPVSAFVRPGFTVSIAGVLGVLPYSNTNTTAVPVTLGLGVEYRFRVLFTDAGVVYSYSADKGKTWTVVWVDVVTLTPAQQTTRLYPGFSNYTSTGTLWSMKAFRAPTLAPALADDFAPRSAAPGRADTAQPWLLPSGSAVPVIAGDLRIPAGQTLVGLVTWDGIADGVWDFDVNFGSAPGATKQVYFHPRYRDPLNALRIVINRVTQILQVVRLANNVGTQVALLSSAAFADNTLYKMRVVCVGSTIKVYQDGVEKLSVSEPFGQYFALCALQINDSLATPDLRVDTIRAWGIPARALLADTFDRPDSTTTLGVGDGGQVYTPFSDIVGTDPVLGIESGRAQYLSVGAGTNDRMARATPTLARASFLAWAVVRTTTAQQGFEGFLLRWIDSANWVALRVQSSGATNFISVFRDLAGVRSALGNSGLPAALNANQDYVVAVQVYGTSFEYWFDGQHVAGIGTLTDFPLNPVGGLYFTSGNTGRVDDLRYVPLGQGAVIHDTFSRVDNASSLGNAELANTPWVNLFSGVWGVVSNQAYNASAGTGKGVAIPVVAQDVDTQADIVRQVGSVGLLARCTATGTDYLLVTFDAATCLVRERVASATVATLCAIPYAWAASGTARTVRVRTRGGVLSVWVNEALVVRQPFSGHATTADVYYGLYSSPGTTDTNRFKLFSIKDVDRDAVGPLPVRDTFNRADSATTLGITETPGLPWNPGNASDTTLPTFGVAAGKAYLASGGGAADMHAWVETQRSDVRITCDLTCGAGGNSAGLLFRRRDGSNYWALRATPSLSTIGLWKNEGGVRISMYGPAPAFPLVDGQVVRLVLEVYGPTFRAWADGNLLATWTDATFMNAGKHGIYTVSSPSSAAWDTLLIEPLDVPSAGLVVPYFLRDSFSRPDTTLGLGSTEGPGAVVPWQQLSKVGTSTWGVVGGRAFVQAQAGSGYELALLDTPLSDVDATVDCVWGAGSGGALGLALRAIDPQNLFTVRAEEASDTVYIRKIVANDAGTTLATWPIAITANTTYRLRAVALGAVISVYLDGVLLGSVTDAQFQSATKHGLFASLTPPGPTYGLDNFGLIGAT